MVRVRVLGALDASLEASGTPGVADLGGPRQRSVLALLLVARGQVVSVDRLVDDLWRGEPPPRAIGALQAYVSHLRRVLEPHRAPRSPAAVLMSEPPGYAIRLPIEAVDAWHFESLVRSAAETTDTRYARTILEQAIGMWRGPAYAEFATEPWAEAEAARLDGLRTVARERWCDNVLRSGEAADAVLAAEVLTRENPLREEGWRLLALALYAGGRQAEALAALRRAREILAEELGLDPGPTLLQLETDVLTHRVTVPAAAGPAHQQSPPAVLARPGRASLDAGIGNDPAGFVGRDDELNVLHALAADAIDRSDRRVSLIAGEAGSGKSTLVNHFAGELAAGNWQVVVGRCPESAGAPPAWAWVEAVRALAAAFDPGPLTPALAPLLDESISSAKESDASFGRFLLSRAVVAYLTNAAARQPLAVVIDDLHRGDAETLALVDAIATGLTGVPLLLIALYRPAEAQTGLQDVLAGIAALPPTRLILGGLDPTHAARLIRSVAGVQPDRRTLAALIDRTAGNPFYLTESARLLGSEGDLVAMSKVPEGVKDVLRRRFARLPELTVSILRLAAVIGREVDIDVLITAAEVDEETVLDALEAGVLAGLLTEPSAGFVRFSHVLVRDTLYEDSPRLRRGRWHARIADALTTVHPGDAAALAHHYHQAGTTATARLAVDAGVRAAEQSITRYAHDTAADLYAQALDDLERVPVLESGPAGTGGRAGALTSDSGGNLSLPTHVTERVELLARLSSSQIVSGAGLAALSSRDQAMRLAHGAGRPDLLIRALTAWDLPTPWILRRYGSVDTEVVALIEQALEYTAATEPSPENDAARCRLLCALVAEVGGELNDQVATAAAEAEQIARRLADPVLIGFALHATCSAVFPVSDPQRFAAISRELKEIGERPGLAVFALLGHHMGVQLSGAAADGDGLAFSIEQMEILIRRYRWRQEERTVQMHRGMMTHLAGRLDEAEAHYLTARELMLTSGAIDAEGIVLLALLTIRITQGRVLELVAGLESVRAAPDVLADLVSLPLSMTGRREEAIALRRNIPPVRHDFFRGLFLTLRGMTVAILNEPVEAAAVYDDLLNFRGGIGGADSGSFAAGPVDTVLGDLALVLGRPERAKAHFEAALTLAHRCGNGHWATQARARLATLS